MKTAHYPEMLAEFRKGLRQLTQKCNIGCLFFRDCLPIEF
jgi:hypothetical protein